MARHDDQNALAIGIGELVVVAASDLRPVLALKASDDLACIRFQVAALSPAEGSMRIIMRKAILKSRGRAHQGAHEYSWKRRRTLGRRPIRHASHDTFFRER